MSGPLSNNVLLKFMVGQGYTICQYHPQSDVNATLKSTFNIDGSDYASIFGMPMTGPDSAKGWLTEKGAMPHGGATYFLAPVAAAFGCQGIVRDPQTTPQTAEDELVITALEFLCDSQGNGAWGAYKAQADRMGSLPKGQGPSRTPAHQAAVDAFMAQSAPLSKANIVTLVDAVVSSALNPTASTSAPTLTGKIPHS